MNNIIYGAVGMLIVVCAALYAGYVVGKRDSEVTTRVNPLVIASCIDPIAFSPENKTFGATTKSIVNMAGQYKLCRTACLAQ